MTGITFPKSSKKVTLATVLIANTPAILTHSFSLVDPLTLTLLAYALTGPGQYELLDLEVSNFTANTVQVNWPASTGSTISAQIYLMG